MTNTDIFIKKDENVSNNKINESEKIVEDCSKGNKCTVTKVNDVFPCDTCKSEFCNGKGVDNSTEKIHWRCHTLTRTYGSESATGLPNDFEGNNFLIYLN